MGPLKMPVGEETPVPSTHGGEETPHIGAPIPMCPPGQQKGADEDAKGAKKGAEGEDDRKALYAKSELPAPGGMTPLSADIGGVKKMEPGGRGGAGDDTPRV